jgi:hypothetical protein
VTGDDLLALFHGFRHSAFRLETLPAYAIDAEAESFTAWKAGQSPPPWQLDRDWCHLVTGATKAGKSMTRVRAVRFPLSDYVRFEMDWGYPQNIEAGEDIRILALRGDDALPFIPDPDLGYDFWLFDDVTVVRMEYDGAGRFIRPVDASDHLSRFIDCRDHAVRRAQPFSVHVHRLAQQLKPVVDDPAVQQEVTALFRRDHRTF